MTTFTIPTPQIDSLFEQKWRDYYLPHCKLEWRDRYLPYWKLKWRCRQLLVRSSLQVTQPYPLLLERQQLESCLTRSPVKLVRIDPTLGEVGLKLWADACQQANKTLFLRIPCLQKQPGKQRSLSWWLKRLTDWIAAVLLLLVLGQIMLWLSLLIWVHSPGPIFFRQWRVGERGKLFQVLKFRTMVTNAEKLHYQVMASQTGLHKREDDPRITPLGRWMRKYSLDELPQLFNVLRGEMSLVGPRPWALYDAVRLSPEGQRRLNALPGITGAWQVRGRSHLLDLDAVNQCDLEYLGNWSLWQDLKILLLTVPKVLSGFGAY